MRHLLSIWLSSRATFLAHDAVSTHGKLVHISCIFKLIHPFLHSISKFAQNFKSARAKLNPPPAVTADFSWISYIISISPNEIQLADPEPLDINWWGDASSSFGIGKVLGNRWAVWSWAPGVMVGPGVNLPTIKPNIEAYALRNSESGGYVVVHWRHTVNLKQTNLKTNKHLGFPFVS
jgi:hypothetical protein